MDTNVGRDRTGGTNTEGGRGERTARRAVLTVGERVAQIVFEWRLGAVLK